MTEVIKIEGGHRLEGEVVISGAKNATVALIPAAVLANSAVTIAGIPQIADVDSLTEILNILHVDVKETVNGHLVIDPSNMENTVLDQDVVTKLRASYYFMGALLGKYGRVCMKMPGGCYLGPRPIDLHLKGFEALGAKVSNMGDLYTIEAEKLIGTKIFLDIASVGATINIMMAAVYAEGRTTIENAAKEPEIIDVATLLNNMGARIRGAGTNVIKIDGVRSLSGCVHEIIPDRIEAGTFIIIAAAMARHMVVRGIIPQHLDALLSKLTDMGINMNVGIDFVEISETKHMNAVNITTKPYPGFATDLQQPLTTLLTQAEGVSRIKETIYIERFKHCDELNKMGASIDWQEGSCHVNGPTPLHGAKVVATDLRCGAAMVVAGLVAQGITEISNVYHIDRGYSEIDRKLRELGAVIWREQIE